MPVKIRLTRLGTKRKPVYRIVATDSRSARDGKHLEILGFYNPRSQPPEVKLDDEKIKGWIKKGAIMSDVVKKLWKRRRLKSPDGGVK